MVSSFLQFLLFAFLIILSASSKCQGPTYKCHEKSTSDLSSDECIVERLDDRIGILVEEGKVKEKKNLHICRTTNSKIEYDINEDCSLSGTIVFCHGTECKEGDETDNKKLTGFYMSATSTLASDETYYNLTLPSLYNKSKGGKFEFRFVNNLIVGEDYSLDISPFPYNRESTSVKMKNELKTLMACKLFKKQNCLQQIEDERCRNKFPELFLNKTVEKSPKPEEQKHSSNVVVVLAVLLPAIALVIVIAAVFLYRKKTWNKKKKIAVIIAPSGDTSSHITDHANQIASELKSSGEYDDVIFNHWLVSTDLDGNLEKLVDALHRSTVILLFASPFGKSSYDNFVEKGQLATWKDEFVICAHSLFHKSNHSLLINKQVTIKDKKVRKVLVVCATDRGESAADVLPFDFREHAHKCYDLSDSGDNEMLYKELLSGKTSKSKNKKLNGDHATEEVVPLNVEV